MTSLRYSINVTSTAAPSGVGWNAELMQRLRERIQLELVDRHEFQSGAVAMRYQPTQVSTRVLK